MEVQTQVLQTISEYLSIPIGQLPKSGGTVMELAPSSFPRRFLDGQSYEQISILILSKDRSQKNALDNLNAACNKCRTLVLPGGEKWQITTIDIATTPNYVASEKNSDGTMWIYSCILTVYFYNMEGF
ncbi:MAG: hypothetical protein ACI4JB_06605 [Porcipelethomonas sp.]